MNKRLIISLLIIIIIGKTTFSQPPTPHPSLLKSKWDAAWIGPGDDNPHEFGVYYFRKKIRLDEKPNQYIINITADNRYRLYVNNHFVCRGPQRSDLTHWKYETVEISKHLKKGTNVISVEVVNFGKEKALAQFSHATGLIIQANSVLETQVNTQPGSWKVVKSKAHFSNPVEWRNQKDITWGFYASYPCDSINGNLMDWDWRTIDYDDSKWPEAQWIAGGMPRGVGHSPWLLEPRNLPLFTEKKEQIPSIIRHSNPEMIDTAFLYGNKPLKIPKNSNYKILLDNQHLTIGYPEIIVSFGKDAKIEITYAEALYDASKEKGDRFDFSGKDIIGYSDIFISDGGENKHYRPNWLRTFRFVELDITTYDDPLEINEYYNNFYAYPQDTIAKFYCDDDALNKIWDISQLTNMICAQDYLWSDAYYEQMQYIGDARIQGLVNTIMSGDATLWKQSIEQFNDSRVPDGLTLACYPNDFYLLIPTYSLIWIYMLYDYYQFTGDIEYIRNYIPAIQGVLFWFEQRINEKDMLGPLEWWNFTDWYPPPLNSEPPGAKEGNSALITLQYVYALQLAAELFEKLDYKEEKAQKLYLAEKLKSGTLKNTYSSSAGLFKESPESGILTQHTNIFAILTNTIPAEDQDLLMQKILSDENLLQASIYFRFYLFKALEQTSLKNMFFDLLFPWHNMILDGLTTTPEDFQNDSPRSDCHPWGTGPCWYFFSTVCGITPMEPGYSKVMIDPTLGTLRHIDAKMPISQGIIEYKLDIDEITGVMKTEIILPKGCTGYFKWKGKLTSLRSGRNFVEKE